MEEWWGKDWGDLGCPSSAHSWPWAGQLEMNMLGPSVFSELPTAGDGPEY